MLFVLTFNSTVSWDHFSNEKGDGMRRTIWLATLLALAVGTTAKAQTQKRGFFGFDPSLFGGSGTSSTPVQTTIPVPNSTIPSSFKLMDLIPKFTSPIGKLNFTTTTIPSYSPLMTQDYLKAFGYIGPKPIGQ